MPAYFEGTEGVRRGADPLPGGSDGASDRVERSPGQLLSGALRRHGTRAAATLLAVASALAPLGASVRPSVTDPGPGGGAQARTRRLTELGITFARPHDYEEVPIEPNERWIVLRLRGADAEGDSANPLPALLLVVIPPAARPAWPGEPVPHSIDDYMASEFQGWDASSLRPGRERWGHEPRRWELTIGEGDLALGAYVHAFESPERTIALVGIAEGATYDRERHTWERFADRLKIEDPPDTSRDRERWLRHYRRDGLGEPDYRAGVRVALVGGWSATDTEHYIIVHNTDDEALVRRVGDDIEDLRAFLVRRFPSQREGPTVATVRICRDRDDYLVYGGRPDAAGYFNADAEELVLYEQEASRGRGERWTFEVLYHEAFHQYIHHSVGGLGPHPWFDEGYGEYFAAARIERGRVEIGVNDQRLRVMREVLRTGEHVPLTDFLRRDQDAYYADPSRHYAQGWAVVHFLAEAAAVREHSRWKGILERYFDGLRAAARAEFAELPPVVTYERYSATMDRVRATALERALDRVDVAALEREWLTYVNRLGRD